MPSNVKTDSVEINHQPHKVTKMELSYPYLEERTYIQGVVALDGMLKCAELFEPDLYAKPWSIKQAKVMREITTFARAETRRKEDALNLSTFREAMVRLDIESGGETITTLLFPHENRPVSKREPTDDYGKHVLSLSIENNRNYLCEIERVTDVIDLIRAIEECHRDLIKMEFFGNKPTPPLRWAYLTDFPLFSPETIPGVSRIEFTERREVKAVSGFFDIRTGNLPELGIRFDFKICFYAGK